MSEAQPVPQLPLLGSNVSPREDDVTSVSNPGLEHLETRQLYIRLAGGDEGAGLRKWYDDLVKQIEREDGLISQRLSWMTQLQGWLFAATAVSAWKDLGDLARLAAVAISGVGLLIAYSTWKGISVAHLTLHERKTEFLKAQLALVRPFGGETSPNPMFASHWICGAVGLAWTIVGAFAMTQFLSSLDG